MRSKSLSQFSLLLALAFLITPQQSKSEIIILRSGEQIKAMGVWEEAGKVKYFNASGQVAEGIEKHRVLRVIPDETIEPSNKKAAIAAVKASRCLKGGTIGEHFKAKVAIPAVQDLGWSSRQDGAQIIVEKKIHIGGLSQPTIYRWSVDSNNVVVPVNGHALGVSPRAP